MKEEERQKRIKDKKSFRCHFIDEYKPKDFEYNKVCVNFEYKFILFRNTEKRKSHTEEFKIFHNEDSKLIL